ncbi:2-oxoglutarate dehydrogenase E1 component [Anaplasmataceae bacterium AB001_6]|nr:2-oxoglutarate dehydrogenase E1 component [Anaplasmataceae bacterium AB001_6]
MKNSPLYGLNLAFLEEIYRMYQENPDSVSKEWQKIMSHINMGLDLPEDLYLDLEKFSVENRSFEPSFDNDNNDEKAFRSHGYKFANTNPLSKENINVAEYISDITKNFKNEPYCEDIEQLKNIYCGKISCEFEHIDDPEELSWLYENFKKYQNQEVTVDIKKRIFEGLMKTTLFENFLHKRFPGAKRFSIEGSESAIVAVNTIIELFSQEDCEEIIIGMAHRGRLSLLASVLEKPLEAIFSEFKGRNYHKSSIDFSGDVKYHLGYSREFKLNNNKSKVTLLNNPSHLEAIDPLVYGKVRALQDNLDDVEQKKAIGLLIHGDASISGQGVVYESFTLDKLADYTSGGVIHIVINNQIGFTTNPKFSRSNKDFPTDIAKSFKMPILHVNGDDPEKVMASAKIASEYRIRFKKDFMIDLIGYRKYGHNEGDEPRFTQPKMYKLIDHHKSVYEDYSQKIIESSAITPDEKKKIEDSYKNKLSESFDNYESFEKDDDNSNTEMWSDIIRTVEYNKQKDTGVKLEIIKDIIEKITILPSDFIPNKKIIKFLDERRKILQNENSTIDWSTAEAIALGSILLESHNIRLAGQDSQRGTFSQRHAVLVNEDTEETYTPLSQLGSKITIVNSYLSEYAASGFEYGYSLANPNNLTIWEAQFGDFANGAQIIIDQFIASAEEKWLQMSNLIFLLPHGYEGQGPEHSSARLERFLQLSARFNWYILNCSTPSNYFHALRRQVCGNIRKPLIIFSPKSLLRLPAAVSSIDKFISGTAFEEIIIDEKNSEEINRIILCSGKISYDLLAYKKNNKIENTLIASIEQLYPFPVKEIENLITKYPKALVVWCQEEPKNMGAWCFVLDNFVSSFSHDKRLFYAGRSSNSSTATGYASMHKIEQEAIIEKAFSIK